jgi:2-(3-amino-3-carboxypropyl)histidine synthase
MDRAVDLIRRSGVLRVGLQAPEGLKRALPRIAKEIQRLTGAEVLISGDPCYGACDVDLRLCEEVDLMLHLGHAGLGEEPLEDNPGEAHAKVIFLEARMREDLGAVVQKAARTIRARRAGVATTVQHIHRLDQALEALKEQGIEGLPGPASGRVRYPGQVLGCCFNAVKGLDVEEYLFIGTGQFHPLGIALVTGKRVIAADPVTGEVSEIDPDPMLRRRFAAIARAMDAKKFAVLVSKKPGQKRMALARHLKALGEAKGLDMFLVYLDNIEPDRLQNLGADAAVSTACPRVALDDAAKYRIPILTPPEFEVLMGERKWDEYGFDEISGKKE